MLVDEILIVFVMLSLAMKHGLKHHSLKNAIVSVTATLVTGIGIGVIVSLVASLLVTSVKKLSDYRLWMGGEFLNLPGSNGSMVPMLWLILAALLLWGVRYLFGITRWHGPADSIYAAHRLDNEIDVRVGTGSTLAAFISMGGGAPVGQYGPLVHFGATVGCYLRQVFGTKLIDIDVFIGCGVAAAIAAGFHAPIAGIVFAHEAILRHFSFRALTPIAISSVTSAWFATAVFGGEPIFNLASAAPELLPMVPVLLGSGVLFGLISMLFMMTLLYATKMAGKSGFGPLPLALSAAVTCGVIALFVPEVLGTGSLEINNIINGGYDIGFLLLLFLLKLIATSLCIGFGLFGGIFSPAAFIGAAAGGFLGKLMAFWGFAAVPALLPIAGFAAVTAAVVGAPISVVLVVLELTQSYEFAVAAMLSAVVATFLTSLVFGHSFFDEQLLRRGIDLSQGRGNLELMSKDICTVVNNSFVSIPPIVTVKDAIDELVNSGSSEGYCVGNKKQFIGKISLPLLMQAPRNDIISQHLIGNPVKLNHDASVMQAMEIASKFIGETIPVVEQATNELVGVVSEADIFEIYLATQSRIRDLEHG
ncbi:chloride channel protein [Alphaproteobacteria bacterium]|nr:chloride channel protein [Alphaproteobacteria bacterium]